MNNIQVWMATIAILCAALGGAVVWSVMTYTIAERAELASLEEDRQALGECVTEKANMLSEVTDAAAEAERLKSNEQR